MTVGAVRALKELARRQRVAQQPEGRCRAGEHLPAGLDQLHRALEILDGDKREVAGGFLVAPVGDLVPGQVAQSPSNTKIGRNCLMSRLQ